MTKGAKGEKRAMERIFGFFSGVSREEAPEEVIASRATAAGRSSSEPSMSKAGRKSGYPKKVFRTSDGFGRELWFQDFGFGNWVLKGQAGRRKTSEPSGSAVQ